MPGALGAYVAAGSIVVTWKLMVNRDADENDLSNVDNETSQRKFPSYSIPPSGQHHPQLRTLNLRLPNGPLVAMCAYILVTESNGITVLHFQMIKLCPLKYHFRSKL